MFDEELVVVERDNVADFVAKKQDQLQGFRLASEK